jgi:hypothetical protein
MCPFCLPHLFLASAFREFPSAIVVIEVAHSLAVVPTYSMMMMTDNLARCNVLVIHMLQSIYKSRIQLKIKIGKSMGRFQ